MNGFAFLMLVLAVAAGGNMLGAYLGGLLEARKPVPTGYPAVVEREGVWWVYVTGQGWIAASGPDGQKDPR